jgi:hypothetical protein
MVPRGWRIRTARAAQAQRESWRDSRQNTHGAVQKALKSGRSVQEVFRSPHRRPIPTITTHKAAQNHLKRFALSRRGVAGVKGLIKGFAISSGDKIPEIPNPDAFDALLQLSLARVMAGYYTSMYREGACCDVELSDEIDHYDVVHGWSRDEVLACQVAHKYLHGLWSIFNDQTIKRETQPLSLEHVVLLPELTVEFRPELLEQETAILTHPPPLEYRPTIQPNAPALI